MTFKTRRAPTGFNALTALGEVMAIRPGDLLAVRRGRFRARPARVLREVPVTPRNRRMGHRILVVLYDEHHEPAGKSRTVKAGDVLGYWQ